MRKAIRKLTDDPTVLRIVDQLEETGKTGKELERYLGVSNGTYTSWKYRNVKSYLSRIDDIAAYLDVSKDYLLEGTDRNINREHMTSTEIKLIKLFREMGNDQQKTYMKIGNYLTEATKFERMDEIISGNGNHKKKNTRK